MTEDQATLELMAAQLAEILDLTEQMRADVREMRASLDRIEGHLRRIDGILQQALGRGGEDRGAVQ
jgi:methyl-accepting chemotaxis protein